MSIRRNVLAVEELGQRILPSASPLTLLGAAPLAHHHVQQQEHALHGFGFAGYTSNNQIPDTGTQYHLQGLGAFGKLGFATVTGDIHSVGFILHGQATGTLTFTNARGSVTVDLTGPMQDSFAALPQQFHYQITGGTGPYTNLHDQGTLQLQMFGSMATPGAPGHGVFTIRI